MMSDMKEAILAVAKTTAQAHGYGGLSFRELAKEVGIKSASLHYHFPNKADLAAALARRYADEAERQLEALLASSRDPAVLFRAYGHAFRAALENDNRMCLYGILSAERDELAPEVHAEVERFAEVNVRWLTKLLALDGKTPKAAQRQAVSLFAAVEGAQLVARGRGDLKLFDEILATYRAVGLAP